MTQDLKMSQMSQNQLRSPWENEWDILESISGYLVSKMKETGQFYNAESHSQCVINRMTQSQNCKRLMESAVSNRLLHILNHNR